MPRDTIIPTERVRGDVRVHRVYPVLRRLGGLSGGLPEGWDPRTPFTHNDFLFEWGAVFGNLLLRRGLNYGIGGMYIEYENTASPGDLVTVPPFGRDSTEGVDYYNGLSDSADRDYLRVPLVAGTLDSTDNTKYPKGNLATFFAQTQGVQGVHGKPFSEGSNSTVFGAALVAFVDEADPTRDLVLSRWYAPTSSQVLKLATSQVGLEWQLTLK